MTCLPAPPARARRLGLASFVLCLHVALLAALTSARPDVSAIVEPPLVVDWIDALALPQAAAPRLASTQAPASAPTKLLPAPKHRSSAVPETTARREAPAADAPALAAETPAVAAAAGAGGSGSTSASTNAGGSANAGDGSLVQARFDADYLKNPAPLYPSMSRRLGEEGKTILRVRVSADGQPEHVDIKTSSGSSRLDESAQKTVRRWTFIPARRGGVSVESWVLVPIVFKLEQ